MTTPEECEHLSGLCYINPPAYPEQERLKPGEMWCHNCQTVQPDPWIAHDKWVAEQECLRGPSGCRGRIRERPSAGGTTMIYECEKHMEQSLQRR